MSSKDPTGSARPGLSGLGEHPDSRELAAYYDTWAAGYDRDLAGWNYRAPAVAAELLSGEVPPDARVLDAGCGTGLSGTALRDRGFQHIAGIDISPASLAQAAQTGAYAQLARVDLQAPSLPFATAGVAGVLCVGVLTYIPDTEGILREFCRVVRRGGAVVFSQRDDIFEKRDCAAALQRLEEEGLWSRVFVSEPQPYLPDHEEYTDQIQARYGVFRVR